MHSPKWEVVYTHFIREGSKKKIRKKSGLLPNRGGGGPEVYINNQPPSAIMCFFKWACKTILGPPKHVLHLDWSVYVTFKTIKIALKVDQTHSDPPLLAPPGEEVPKNGTKIFA